MEHRLNIKIEPELRKQLKVKAAKEGVTIRTLVIDLIKQWLKNK